MCYGNLCFSFQKPSIPKGMEGDEKKEKRKGKREERERKGRRSENKRKGKGERKEKREHYSANILQNIKDSIRCWTRY